jgi:hypothetical protein
MPAFPSLIRFRLVALVFSEHSRILRECYLGLTQGPPSRLILRAPGQYSASWKQAQRAGDEGWGYDNHGLKEVDMGSASAANQGDELIEMA